MRPVGKPSAGSPPVIPGELTVFSRFRHIRPVPSTDVPLTFPSHQAVVLPKVELAGALKAAIEVLRADGSLASKTGIELSPAAETLALGN